MDIDEKNYRLQRLQGLFVGLLDPEDKKLFEEAVDQGCATRNYDNTAGFLGMAKVALVYLPKPMK